MTQVKARSGQSGRASPANQDAAGTDATGAAQPDASLRILKKYPNRRLYDTQTSGYITLADVRQMVLDSRVFSAERFKTQALNLVCTTPQIAVAGMGSVDVTAACAALRASVAKSSASNRSPRATAWASTGTSVVGTCAFAADASSAVARRNRINAAGSSWRASRPRSSRRGCSSRTRAAR